MTGDEDGMLKLLVSTEDRSLLGVHVLGTGAADRGSGGRDRSEAEYAALLASAGLALSRVIPTWAGTSLIEAATA